MIAATLPALLLAAGCGTSDSGQESAPEATETEESTPHGYIEGAEEAAEPQSRLVLADAGTGGIHVLDLITEEITEAGEFADPQALRGDGRYGYLTGADGTVQVVDSGAWTVDHGDHSHYYRAAIELGEQLPAGTVPYRETPFTVADGTVSGPGLEESCADPSPSSSSRGYPMGTAVTRAGLVLGCADGALLVTEQEDAEGQFTAERLPYPDGTEPAARAGEFHHRAGSTTLAALAADGSGFWLLDVTTGDWQFTADDTVTAVNAVGSGGAVLTLTDTGELVSRDGTDGTETARVPLTGDRIEVDSSRAYISDPEGQQVVEIDYADGLRTARTFDLGFTPSYMVETGR
ncbi:MULTISPECIES: VCBS domain-containing protein [Streptomyces]|uniref:VCBS domain-containing protein n=1 Tax=Streptomyces TaxID=1883 RepID=UPI002176A28E|nr:VCBS domain-containing protein [Streptomyces ginkgonis]